MQKTMNKQIFINQLKKLIAFKTVTGNVEENSKALDYIESLLPKDVSVKRHKNKNAEILVASTLSQFNPDIGYLVHMDVVVGRPEQFIPKTNGDKIIGRGASDMKFSIPIGISLLKFAKENKIDFTLAITTDEETGGEEGASYLASVLKFKPKILIVPDGGDNLTFVNKSKGVCWLTVSSKGKPAHASRPWIGKNALEPIAKLASELTKVYGKSSLKENWDTTMNIGQIKGGISTNQVCPEAIMKLDFRYPETDSISNIANTVKKIAAKIDPNLRIQIDSTALPTFTDKNLSVVKKFVSSMSQVYKKKIIVAPTYGASDASHFSPYNIPILMIKPLGGEIHSDNEWVSISSSIRFYEGLKLFIANQNIKL